MRERMRKDDRKVMACWLAGNHFTCYRKPLKSLKPPPERPGLLLLNRNGRHVIGAPLINPELGKPPVSHGGYLYLKTTARDAKNSCDSAPGTIRIPRKTEVEEGSGSRTVTPRPPCLIFYKTHQDHLCVPGAHNDQWPKPVHAGDVYFPTDSAFRIEDLAEVDWKDVVRAEEAEICRRKNVQRSGPGCPDNKIPGLALDSKVLKVRDSVPQQQLKEEEREEQKKEKEYEMKPKKKRSKAQLTLNTLYRTKLTRHNDEGLVCG